MASLSVEERFWQKVNKNGPYSKKCRSKCWIWTATGTRVNGGGYGQLSVHAKRWLAHRFSLVLAGQELREDLEVDHLCKTKRCVRPSHLEQVPRYVNWLRSSAPSVMYFKKTHCPKGHPYSGDNLYMYPDGRRECRTCSREYKKLYKARIKERNP